MIKYRTGDPRTSIEKVEVVRETKHSVWFPSGYKHSKWTDGNKYHDTWKIAHKYLLTVANNTVIMARHQVSRAEINLSKIEALKEA
jgi:hypothetical protein